MYYLTEVGKRFLNESEFKDQMIRNHAFYRLKRGLPPGDFTRREKSQIDQQVSYQKIIDAQKIRDAAILAAQRKRGTSGGTT